MKDNSLGYKYNMKQIGLQNIRNLEITRSVVIGLLCYSCASKPLCDFQHLGHCKVCKCLYLLLWDATQLVKYYTGTQSVNSCHSQQLLRYKHPLCCYIYNKLCISKHEAHFCWLRATRLDEDPILYFLHELSEGYQISRRPFRFPCATKRSIFWVGIKNVYL